MAERKERMVYDGSKRRIPERRQAQRRRSDKLKTFMRYLAVAILAAVLVSLLD